MVEEPSVVAVRRGGGAGDVLAVGKEARDMFGRTPAGIEVVRPLRGGVIADFEATEQLLHHLLRRAGSRALLRPRVLVCVPSETTEVERRAVQESVRAAGGRDVVLVATPIAAAIGAELPVSEPIGSMLIDVGAGQTEVAVLSLGGMVVYHAVRVAGDAINDAIALWLRSKRNLIVGDQTAEEIKMQVGCAEPLTPATTMRVRGRDLGTGRPREVELSSDELPEALAEPVARIRETVLAALERTPPELSADILDRGIILCGGTSRLRHLDRVLRQATGLPIITPEDPLRCAVRGAAALLEDSVLFARVAGP